jgi:predicted Zn-dependent peptidase
MTRRKPQFKKTVFENGLTLLSERLPEYRSLSMGIWVRVGTRHETGNLAGASHFLEHMLFKGTGKRSALDIAREVDQVGGEFNAFTAREHTCFHLLLLDRDYQLGLDILSDILLNSNLKTEEMERERKVILQEICMVEDSPEELAYDLFFENIYGDHGLGKPILGTQKSICEMKREDVLRFFRTYYRPDQIIFSVAGDVSHEALKKKIRPLLKKIWPGRMNSHAKLNHWIHPRAPKIQSGSWWVERPTEQAHLIWGVQGLPYSSEDRFAAFLLNVYLGGGMSSSLFQEIREKNGLAYTVYSNLSPFVDSGVFSIYAATSPEQTALCLKLIEKCVTQVKKKPLSKKELTLIQNNLKGTILLSSDNAESRMCSIAKNEIFLREYISPEDVCRQIDRVTPEQIQRVAHELFQNKHRSIFALGAKPNAKVMKELKAYGF